MRDRIRQVSTITENVAKGGESHWNDLCSNNSYIIIKK